MQVPRCIASEMMTDLLVWRNPQGEERNWQRYQLVNNEFEFPFKVTATFFALPIVEIVATIETVVYTILATASLLFLPFDDEPFLFFAEALSSSLITQLWVLADVIANLFFINVLTHESFVRHQFLPFTERACDFNYVIHNSVPQRNRFDINYLEGFDNVDPNRNGPELVRNDPLEAYNSLAHRDQPTPEVQAGINFLINFVMKGQSSHTKELFNEQDGEIFAFVLSRAIGIYLVGEKKDEPVPVFFKPTTQSRLDKMRNELGTIQRANPAIYAMLILELNKCIANPESITKGSEDILVSQFLRGGKGTDGIQTLGNWEIQGSKDDDSIILTKSWPLSLNKIK